MHKKYMTQDSMTQEDHNQLVSMAQDCIKTSILEWTKDTKNVKLQELVGAIDSNDIDAMDLLVSKMSNGKASYASYIDSLVDHLMEGLDDH
jgi:hypothetical protein